MRLAKSPKYMALFRTIGVGRGASALRRFGHDVIAMEDCVATDEHSLDLLKTRRFGDGERLLGERGPCNRA
jgi:hypothetical protein